MESLHVRGLSAHIHLTHDGWTLQGVFLQPVTIDLEMQLSITTTAHLDQLVEEESLSYSTVAKWLHVSLIKEDHLIQSLPEWSHYIATILLKTFKSLESIRVAVTLRHALLFAKALVSETWMSASGKMPFQQELLVKDWQIAAIIGVNQCERVEEQPILVQFKFSSSHCMNIYQLLNALNACYQMIRQCHCKTVEAMVNRVYAVLREQLTESVEDKQNWQIYVNLEKPSALRMATSAGVSIQRQIRCHSSETKLPSNWTKAYISMGSNLGNRYDFILNAFKSLRDEKCQIRVTNSSLLYETVPFVRDVHRSDDDIYPDYLNACLEVETSLDANALLEFLQEIETSNKRTREANRRDTPRTLDLDLIFYGNKIIQTPSLTVPHPLCHQREFVLKPMCDISPDFVHPQLGRTVQELLDSLDPHPSSAGSILCRVMPWMRKGKVQLFRYQPDNAFIVGICNVSPESFSNVGKVTTTHTSYIEKLVQQGADMIDLGAVSTRPGHESDAMNEDLERTRLLPLFKELSSLCPTIPISLDTCSASIARQGLEMNAIHMINHVDACHLERAKEMQLLVKEKCVPYWIMLGRDTLFETSSVSDVEQALNSAVQHCLELGIPRWLLGVDVGLGFDKDHSLSTQLVTQRLSLSLPVMSGASRKRFIGHAIGALDQGADSPERGMASVVASVLAVDRGAAQWLRVHDVKEMKVALMMWKAIQSKENK